MSNDILVLAEHQDNKVKKISLELLSKATGLASQTGGSVSAVLIGSDVEGAARQLAPYGAKKVYLVSGASFEKYNTIAYSQAMAAVVERAKPGIVLGTASPMGKDLIPRLAAKLKAGFASECTDLRIEPAGSVPGGKLVGHRPIYSGKVFVDVVFNSAVQMATTRANSFPTKSPQEGANAELVKVDVGGETTLRCPMKQMEKGETGKVDLTEAEVIISGGRALGNTENFKILREMADVIGATVGASRAAVDSGYAPHDIQVGQTGKVVNPKLYIACGISGAIQHLAGMRTSKVIVAINKDPEAPIFQKADYGVVGDLFTVVPLLTQEFKKVLAE
ncbi:MAG: electron transfer flavoprotein subunit alpha/FixB family protein [Deltaproteobacteria bacterium]|nr:electron transfer flavoprotein subunit alpha/FixB family protein [Deltaproteobacteria bacterium]